MALEHVLPALPLALIKSCKHVSRFGLSIKDLIFLVHGPNSFLVLDTTTNQLLDYFTKRKETTHSQ